VTAVDDQVHDVLEPGLDLVRSVIGPSSLAEGASSSMIGSPELREQHPHDGVVRHADPMVRRLRFCRRFGTSRVASSRNVYGRA